MAILTMNSSFNLKDDYKAAWRTVDHWNNRTYSFRTGSSRGNYKAAKKDNNQPQFIKSVFYKLKYGNYIEEDSHVKLLMM